MTIKIDRIQCLVRLHQNEGGPNLTEVPRAGPSAPLATEIPLLRRQFDIGTGLDEESCSVHRARVVGQVETTRQAEYERLCLTYGAPAVNSIYPGGRGMALTIDDVELPLGCHEAPPAPREPEPTPATGPAIETQDPPAPPMTEEAMREILIGRGVDIPEGADAEKLRELMTTSDAPEAPPVAEAAEE